MTRIALGQWIDELDIGTKISSAFGIDSEPSGPEDKVGTKRLGSDNLLENLGISLFLVTIIMIFLVLFVLLIRTIKNRSKLSKKA